MNKIISYFLSATLKKPEIPLALLQLIDQQPIIRVQLDKIKAGIDATMVGNWHDWGEKLYDDCSRRQRGTIQGWRQSAGMYISFELHRSEFEKFGSYEIVKSWSCDIQDVTGLAASKSHLSDFENLDSMVENNSPDFINELSEDKLLNNLSHNEVRIVKSDNLSDRFACYRWDGRVLLINNGGSHHFAAARYIASRIGRRVGLQGKLYRYSIDALASDSLIADFDMYAISSVGGIPDEFRKAMEAFKATYLIQGMPLPYRNMKAVLLPKQEHRSMIVSRALREAGMFDIGSHLTDLVNRQSTCH